MKLAETDRVYCDIGLSLEEGLAMLQFLRDARMNRSQPTLDGTFRWMEQQIVDSIGQMTKRQSSADRHH